MLVNFDYIKNLWQHIDKNEDISLYVHTPFCKTQCKYCLYSGKINPSDIEVGHFVKSLKLSLQRIRPILRERKVKTLYFGGGTPNFYKIEDLLSIMDMAYDISNPESFILELNPAFLTEKQLKDILKRKVTLITFGVQTFKKSTLERHNRPYTSLEKIVKYTDICHQNNVKVSIDLMCYLNSYSNADIDILEDDIQKGISSNVDFITIYPEQNLIKKDKTVADYFANYLKSKTVKNDYNGYYIDITKENKSAGWTLKNNPSLVYRLINKKHSYDDFKNNILPYYENDFADAIHNIIGIGDKNNSQKVVSYSPNKFFYTEQYAYGEPLYDVKFENT